MYHIIVSIVYHKFLTAMGVLTCVLVSTIMFSHFLDYPPKQNISLPV